MSAAKLVRVVTLPEMVGSGLPLLSVSVQTLGLIVKVGGSLMSSMALILVVGPKRAVSAVVNATASLMTAE